MLNLPLRFFCLTHTHRQTHTHTHTHTYTHTHTHTHTHAHTHTRTHARTHTRTHTHTHTHTHTRTHSHTHTEPKVPNSGPFVCTVTVRGWTFEGTGPSKKRAKCAAAEAALSYLNNVQNIGPHSSPQAAGRSPSLSRLCDSLLWFEVVECSSCEH